MSSETLGDWTARTVTSVETVDPAPVAALAALLDSGTGPVGPGDVLPPLWHWVGLPRWSTSSRLGLDGHPRRGDFLPPIDLPRRMFAGGEVVLHGELRVGQQVERESVVESVAQKDGRSGRLAVVKVRVLLRALDGEPVVEERQDIVYREAASTGAGSRPEPGHAAALRPAGPPLEYDGAGWRFVTDPTLLMRFSAATANAHRIHYDWPYATRVEGYPGLVVHGPLSTLALAETLRLAGPGDRVQRLRHRNTAPLFCGEEARVTHSCGHSDRPGAVEAVLKTRPGTLVASLDAEFGR